MSIFIYHNYRILYIPFMLIVAFLSLSVLLLLFIPYRLLPTFEEKTSCDTFDLSIALDCSSIAESTYRNDWIQALPIQCKNYLFYLIDCDVYDHSLTEEQLYNALYYPFLRDRFQISKLNNGLFCTRYLAENNDSYESFCEEYKSSQRRISNYSFLFSLKERVYGSILYVAYRNDLNSILPINNRNIARWISSYTSRILLLVFIAPLLILFCQQPFPNRVIVFIGFVLFCYEGLISIPLSLDVHEIYFKYLLKAIFVMGLFLWVGRLSTLKIALLPSLSMKILITPFIIINSVVLIFCVGIGLTIVSSYFREIYACSTHINETIKYNAIKWNIFPILMVVTVVVEECFYRGILFDRLRSVMSPIKAAIIISLIFAVSHQADIFNFAEIFFGSCIITAVYSYTKNLWPCIIVHLVHNLLLYLLRYHI